MTIKKLLVLSIFVYLAVFLSQGVLGGSEEKAYVYVAIEDAPPRILSVKVVPEIAYADSEISCQEEIYDENMSLLDVRYEWHLNDEPAGSGKFLQADLQAGDLVACRIAAVDAYHHMSEETSQNIKIQPRGIVQLTGLAIGDIRESLSREELAAAGAVMLFIIIVSGFNLEAIKAGNR